MAAFDTIARVRANGVVNMTMVPVLSGHKPPTSAQVLAQIDDGLLDVNHERLPLSKSRLGTAMCNIQRDLTMKTGVGGGWNEEAWRRLKEWLLVVKKARTQPLAILPPPAPPVLQAPPALLALPAPPAPPDVPVDDGGEKVDDDGDASSSSSSTSSSSTSKPTLRRRLAEARAETLAAKKDLQDTIDWWHSSDTE